MAAPSQKARERVERDDPGALLDKYEILERASILDSFTLELREALREAICIAEETTISREISRLSEVLDSYTPTPEEEKG